MSFLFHFFFDISINAASKTNSKWKVYLITALMSIYTATIYQQLTNSHSTNILIVYTSAHQFTQEWGSEQHDWSVPSFLTTSLLTVTTVLSLCSLIYSSFISFIVTWSIMTKMYFTSYSSKLSLTYLVQGEEPLTLTMLKWPVLPPRRYPFLCLYSQQVLKRLSQTPFT